MPGITGACRHKAPISTERSDDGDVVCCRTACATRKLNDVKLGSGPHERITLLNLNQTAGGLEHAGPFVHQRMVTKTGPGN